MLTRGCFILLTSLSLTALALGEYSLGPLSQVTHGVPQGTVTAMPVHESKIFAGTKRDWWIYVPAQYTAEKPANLMVFQDGHDYIGVKGAWRVPVVFDNLIASGDLSHRLIPGAPAGYSKRGEEFDKKLIGFLKDSEVDGILNLFLRF